jgi:mannose-6-phosphate isomerase-like protein (cupin superfamily)
MSSPAAPALVERITDTQGTVLALVVRREYAPDVTTFVTEPESGLQVGLIVYPAQGSVPRHRHHPIERRLTGTPEVLVVREGRCQADIFDDEAELLATCELSAGDLIVLLGGGHGFRMLDDTVLVEVKQGPYPGVDEKERF